MDNVREKLVAGQRGYRRPFVEVRRPEDIECAGSSIEFNPDVTCIYYGSAYIEVGHDSHCLRNIYEYFLSHLIDRAGPSTVNPRVPCECSNSRNGMLMRVEDPAVAARLIKEGASVSYKDGKGLTALHLSRNVEIAALLLENGADINCANDFGHTPLYYARTPEIAAWLIDHGADIHSRDTHGNTPLHKFADECEVNTRRMVVMIEKGANIDALNDLGQAPLHFAAQDRMVGAVATLLYYNADTSIREESGLTPIMYNLSDLKYRNASECLIYEMLIGYEYNFSCSANGDPAVLTMALVSKSPYLDEMIGLGVDFSNLGRELRILFWCIDQPDIEEFKWFWDIFDYEKSWNYCNSILEFLFTRRKYSFFDYVLESPKLKVLMEVQHRNEYTSEYLEAYDELNFSPVTKSLFVNNLTTCNINITTVLDAAFNGYNKSKAEQAIFVLLSYGYAASEEDAHRIFKLYGYGPLFELLLHLDLERNKHCRTNRRKVRLSLAEVLLNPWTNARKFVIQRQRIEEMEIEDPSVFNREIFIMGEGVPSLVELSRNQARIAIWNGYKMQNIKQFYTTVKWMVISQVIKDILNFKVPIYDPHEN